MAPGRRCTTLLVALVLPLLGSEQRGRGRDDAKLPAFDDEVLWQDLRSTPGHGGQCSSGNLTTLVLEAGGVKGIAYSGSACALEAAGLLPGITTFRGTSAGAIAAALLAAGYDCDALHAAMWKVDFSEFLSDGLIASLDNARSSFGLYDGRRIERHVGRLLEARLGAGTAGITFAELYRRTGKELQLTATSLTTSRLVYFDAERTPDVPVAKAVRASASIPLLFTPCEIDGQLFVDGGVLRSMPVNEPSRGAASADGGAVMALGLRSMILLGDELPVYSLSEFVTRLYKTVVWGPDSANSLLETRQANVEYLPIDTAGVGGRDFHLSDEQKRELVRSGWLTVMGKLLQCDRARWPDVARAATRR